jgi:hypothetical protein
MNMIGAARLLAVNAHAGQKYGEHPYEVHLDHVASVLLRFEVATEDLLVAAYLHDSLEDTRLTREFIAVSFGENVAALVSAVTDEKGVNRKERAAKTYPKIRRAGIDAVTLKLADRIANTEHGRSNGDSRFHMYCKEFPEFTRALFLQGERDGMWHHLRLISLKNPYSIGWFRDPMIHDRVFQVTRMDDATWFITPYESKGDARPNGEGQMLTIKNWMRLEMI